LSDKIFGYIAEWAALSGCSDVPIIEPLPFLDDTRIINKWNNASEEEQKIARDLYIQMVEVTQKEAKNINAKSKIKDIFNNIKLSTSQNDPIDVQGDHIEIHVKFNDDKRMSSLRNIGEIKKTKPKIENPTNDKKTKVSFEGSPSIQMALKKTLTKIKFSLKTKYLYIDENTGFLKKTNLLDKNGVIRFSKILSPEKLITSLEQKIKIKKSKFTLNPNKRTLWLQAIINNNEKIDRYQNLLKVAERSVFLENLKKFRVPEKLLDAAKNIFLPISKERENREVYFFKYFTTASSKNTKYTSGVRLEVTHFSAANKTTTDFFEKGLDIEPVENSVSNTFYRIKLKNSDQTFLNVELRFFDGQKHPPYLTLGSSFKDLYNTYTK